MIIYQSEFLGTDDFWSCKSSVFYSYPLHMHRSIELIYILSGEVHVACKNKEYLLQSGDSIMIMPDTVHSFTRDSGSAFIYLCFSPDAVTSFMKHIQNAEPVYPVFRLKPELVPLLLELDNNSDIPALTAKGLFYMLCSDFLSKTQWQPVQQTDSLLLYKVINFIQQHFNEDISLSMLSKHFGYDYHYMSRYLKKNLNISFSSYLTQYRITHACFLLREKNLTITEIAHLSGYSCIRNFNTAFRNITGTTPKDYRKLSALNLNMPENI